MKKIAPMKKVVVTLTVLLLAITAFNLLADDKAQQKKLTPSTVGMRVKLDLSKEILSGLATADFELIEKNAKGMKALNAIEEFVRGRKTTSYRLQLNIFQMATDELVQAAETKNLDRATLAYSQMTISCVNCHKNLRLDDPKAKK